MAFTRLRDVPGGFTVEDVQNRYNTTYPGVKDCLRRRTCEGLLNMYPVSGINRVGVRCRITVYQVPNTTTVDWKVIDELLKPKNTRQKHWGFLSYPAYIQEYKIFWGVTRANAEKRLRTLRESGVLQVQPSEQRRGCMPAGHPMNVVYVPVGVSQ